ncbi:MAG: hypothetical protein ACRD2N_11685 [Vicinamibacterales bacterium]
MLAAHFAAVSVTLLLVGRLLPPPAISDHEMMEYVGQGVINPGCTNLNCWRILAAAIVERFPGPSLPRWRTYAALGNAAGAAITAQLAITLGLPRHAALLAMWISALSVGSFTTVYHPYTSDSMIFFLAPLIMLLWVRQRLGAAGTVAAIGIFAKEFAAAPLFIGAGAAGLLGEWPRFRRSLLIGLAVTAFWTAYQISLMVFFDYAYDANPSINLFAGGYFWYWLQHVSPLTAIATVFASFGAAYLLAAAGLIRAPDLLRALAAGAVLPALAFMYVETPDRALFNLFFVVAPLAALALISTPLIARWVFVASYGLANLRMASSWEVLPPARFALGVSLAVALVAVVRMRRQNPAPSMVTKAGWQKANGR